MGIGTDYDLKMAEHCFSGRNLANDERAILLLGYIAECNNDFEKALNHYSRFSLNKLLSSKIEANGGEAINQVVKQISNDLTVVLKDVVDNRLSLINELGSIGKCPENEVLSQLLIDYAQGNNSVAMTCMLIAMLVNQKKWYEIAAWAHCNEGQWLFAKSCLIRSGNNKDSYPLWVMVNNKINAFPALGNDIAVETGKKLIDGERFSFINISTKDAPNKMLRGLKEWSSSINKHLIDKQFSRESSRFHQWFNQEADRAKAEADKINKTKKKKRREKWFIIIAVFYLIILYISTILVRDHEYSTFFESIPTALVITTLLTGFCFLVVWLIIKAAKNKALKKDLVATPYKDWYPLINIKEIEIWFNNPINKNNAEAQVALGHFYLYGLGNFQQNLPIAVELFRKAAESGNAEAQFCLGYLYETGTGVKKNDSKAFEWYKKAANQGYADAQNNAGNLCLKKKKHKEAIRFYILAADQECVQARNNLGNCDGQAVHWFHKAAEQGDADAQYNLGCCYDEGNGVKQDYGQAVHWYRKAAEQGHADAQNNLGCSYRDGEGVKQDYSQAVHWYRKAAEQGHADAQYYLGECYHEGDGVSQDYSQAVYWYRKAAEQDDADAQNNLGWCYNEGNGVSQDYNQAVHWFRKAAEQENDEAQFRLGLCYEKGHGVSRDINKAVELYRKAATQDNEDAQKALKRLGYDW